MLKQSGKRSSRSERSHEKAINNSYFQLDNIYLILSILQPTIFDIRHDGVRHSTSTLRFDKRNSTRFAIDGIRRQSTAFDIIF